MLKLRIGIIGRGFVGGAIEKLLNEHSDHDVISYDIKGGIEADYGYSKVVTYSDIIYLCLPTPMDGNGKCYTGIVREAVRLLNFWAREHNKCPIVLLKSTMVPGTTMDMLEEHSNLILVTNPEFLTERNAYEDFRSAKKHLFGLIQPKSNPIRRNLESFHKGIWGPRCECVFVTPTEAEMIKYLTNTFFSMKVTFANHIYDLCDTLDIDYTQFIDKAIQADPRLGDLHWQVPGPDGKRGFGGSCFPKDLSGMINLLEDNGLPFEMLAEAWNYNVDIRGDLEWEKLKGRAVLNDNCNSELLPQTTESPSTD